MGDSAHGVQTALKAVAVQGWARVRFLYLPPEPETSEIPSHSFGFFCLTFSLLACILYT